MAGTRKAFISMDYNFVMVVVHASACFVQIGAEQVLRAADNRGIGAFNTLATGSGRGKEIIISIFFQNISAFIGGSGYLPFFSARFNRKAVI